MTTDPDDAELIARSLHGHADAFVEVVLRHEGAVGAYLARRVGRDQAEDLLGEVWAAALTSRATYDRSFPDAGAQLGPWTAVDDRAAAEPVLRRALALLKTQQREIVTLVAWEDLTVADAGRAIGIPPGTARRLLHEARTALRNAPGTAALLTDLNAIKEAN